MTARVHHVTAVVAAALISGVPAGESWAAGRPATKPSITAPAAVLVDAEDGDVLYRRSPFSRRAIASATKLMTALIVLEELPLGRRLRAAPYSPGPLESRIDLAPNERMAVGDLLRGLLLESANDAAVTLAAGAAGSVKRFTRWMDRRAGELGLSDTSFSNPVGFDGRDNFSSALDLSRLARRLLRNDAFAAIVDMPRARLRSGARPRVVKNRNRLVARVPWIDGVKTGHTSRAGYVLVGSGTRKDVRLVSVVLGASSEAARDADTLALLEYGFRLYRRVQVLKPGEALAAARVAFHGGLRVKLTPVRHVSVTVRRGERVRKVVDAPEVLDGPLDKGAGVGWVSVYHRGDRVARVPLVTAGRVPGAGPGRRLVELLSWPGLVAVLLAGATLATLAVRRRRRGEG